MTDKGFNIFDECASRCVYISPQEEECNSSSWGDSYMYTFDSMARPQSMLTENNESGAIAKNWILVESDTVKCLKAFRITYSEIPTLIFILFIIF